MAKRKIPRTTAGPRAAPAALPVLPRRRLKTSAAGRLPVAVLGVPVLAQLLAAAVRREAKDETAGARHLRAVRPHRRPPLDRHLVPDSDRRAEANAGGSRGTRLDALHLRSQGADLRPKGVKESTICSDSLADLASQVLVALGLDHDPVRSCHEPRNEGAYEALQARAVPARGKACVRQAFQCLVLSRRGLTVCLWRQRIGATCYVTHIDLRPA